KGEEEFDIYGDIIPSANGNNANNVAEPEQRAQQPQTQSNATPYNSYYQQRTDPPKEDARPQYANPPTQYQQPMQSFQVEENNTYPFMYNGHDDQSVATHIICIENLTWWTTDAYMESLLCQFGKVISVWFIEEKINGKSKGVCFCQFDSVDAARMAKDKLMGTEVNSRQIVVSYSSGAPTSRFAGPANTFSSNNERGNFQGYRGGRGGSSRGSSLGNDRASSRGEYNDRSERNERNERNDRTERNERNERSDRGDRGDGRNERSDRSERRSRGRDDDNEKNEYNKRPRHDDRDDRDSRRREESRSSSSRSSSSHRSYRD
ncbi:hypothetical protein AKO1_011197, partial [Acrasis kona]